MSITSKNKVLLAAVIILLITNIAMLVFFLSKSPEKKGYAAREAMMSEFLKEDVGFSAQQMQQYDTLSKAHRTTVKALFDEVRNSKAALFKELGATAFSDSVMNIAVNSSVEKQKGIELSMLQHFVAIRKICTPQQQGKFDSLFYKVFTKKK